MAEDWLTYADLGDRLGVTPEAARQKAIRARWPRRTANDGRAQVRVDVEDVRAGMPARRPRDEEPDDGGPTPVEHPADARTLDALDAHITTLREMVDRADGLVEIERGRASDALTQAAGERARADRERERADALAGRIEAMHAAEGACRADLEARIVELRETVEAMRAPRPWWRRLAG